MIEPLNPEFSSKIEFSMSSYPSKITNCNVPLAKDSFYENMQFFILE